MIFETGYAWTTGFADDYPNFLTGRGEVVDFDISADGQRAFLLAMGRAVADAGATGVFYWEPAWVTSQMCDRWGRGSSYETATLFDFEDGNRALPGFDFFGLCGTSSNSEVTKDSSAGTVLASYGATWVVFATPLQVRTWRIYDGAGRLLATGAGRDLEPTGRVTLREPLPSVALVALERNDGTRAVQRLVSSRWPFRWSHRYSGPTPNEKPPPG